MNEKKVTDLLYGKFVGQDPTWRPNILGIYYADGYMQATNGFILAKVHFEEYDFDLEETIVNKDGSIIAGKFPDFTNILNSQLTEPEELVLDLFRACKRLPISTNKAGKFVTISLEGARFHTFQLAAIFELFEAIGELPRMQVGANANQVVLVFKSQNCTAICVSEIRGLTPKDLSFSVTEALEFDSINAR